MTVYKITYYLFLIKFRGHWMKYQTPTDRPDWNQNVSDAIVYKPDTPCWLRKDGIDVNLPISKDDLVMIMLQTHG